MHQQDGRPDPVEERDAGIAVELLLLAVIGQRLELRGVEGIERRIAGLAGSGPLRVPLRLRPEIETLGRDEALLGALEIGGRHRPLRQRPVRGAAARHLIDHVDCVPAAQEILRPAFAAVGGGGEIGAGLAAAVDHHDGKGDFSVCGMKNSTYIWPVIGAPSMARSMRPPTKK